MDRYGTVMQTDIVDQRPVGADVPEHQLVAIIINGGMMAAGISAIGIQIYVALIGTSNRDFSYIHNLFLFHCNWNSPFILSIIQSKYSCPAYLVFHFSRKIAAGLYRSCSI